MSRCARGQRLLLRSRMRGAVLAVALIFLIVLTLLGLSVMSNSQQELKTANQYNQQNRVQSRTEDCLKTAESVAAAQVDAQLNRAGGALSHSPGFLDMTDGASAAAIGDPAWWDDASHSLPCDADSRYVIEYLGAQDIVLAEDRYTGRTHRLHAFRITARGTAGGDTSVVLQTIFTRNSS